MFSFFTQRKKNAEQPDPTDSKYSFSSSLDPYLTKFYKNMIWAYEHAPFNFSFITGLHHPDVNRLWGDPLLGRVSWDSHGLNNDVQELAKLASKDKRGMAYCSYGHHPVLLLTRPSDIEQVAIFNEDHTNREEVLKAFSHVFGHNNLFSMPAQEPWKEKRNILRKWIFTENVLNQFTGPMQEIIDEYIKEIRQKGKVLSLENFMVSLAMDLFTRTTLHTASLKDSVDKISHSFNSAFIATTNPKNMILLKLKTLGDYFNIKINLDLDKEKIKLEDVVRANFLIPNKHNLSETQNFLQHYFQEHKEEQAIFNAAYSDAAFLLLAGHETTSRLLQFSMMLLYKHPKVLMKLREEISKHLPKEGLWKREDLKNLPFLIKIIKETLRLYPPVPVIARMVTTSFIVGNIPRCQNKKEYSAAMKTRDVTQDIVLAPGTIILISPLVTQRLDSVYKNPLDFCPNRFNSVSISPFDSKDAEDDPCAWFPFGLGKRDCVGRNIAVQETMLTLIKMVQTFDFSMKSLCQDNELLPTYMQGTLKHHGAVEAEFKERHSLRL